MAELYTENKNINQQKKSNIIHNCTVMGLDEGEVLISREKHGDNSLGKPKRKSIFKRVLENLGDPIVKILIGALVANIIFTFKNINWAENLGILSAIFISTLISTLSERGSERAFEGLEKMSGGKTAAVYRSGKLCLIDINDIVVGDKIYITPGEAIFCDGYIISGEISVDQSALNGESREKRKSPEKTRKGDFTPDGKSTLFRGSLVVSGSGIMVATKVGVSTLYGSIAGELKNEKRESPLKLRLRSLANGVAKIGYFAAIAVALTYLFNVIFIDSAFNKEVIFSRLSDWRFIASSIIKAITIAITVIVVAVPEGLPMMITVVLSSNVRKMMKDNVLVRTSVGIETAGSMNILFCDKTGTVTTGRLGVKEIITGEGISYRSSKAIKKDGIYKYFLPSVIPGSSARFINGIPSGGNSTERALLEFITPDESCDIDAQDYFPFDSKNKFSSVTVQGLTLYKGAPEKLLPLCDRCYDKDGNTVGFKSKGELSRRISEISSHGGRVIVMTSKLGGSPDSLSYGMTFLCAVSIKDSIRPEAKAAVNELNGAGIQVVMITGDARDTAASIARECGILKNAGDLVLESKDIAALSDERLTELLPSIKVIARALPSDKSRLVKLAGKKGLVVGMTGDGVNDAPALKMADVGFSMGSGTDIAKEASDIVILDDRLSSISNAVLYGRTIFKSIKKFILFQLTMNLSAVGVSLFGQLMGIDSPVTVIQMLWVNIIMDTLGGLAFAGEAPMKRYMKEKPKRRAEPILDRSLIWRVVTVGAYVVGMCSLFLRSEHFRDFYGFYTDSIYFMTSFFALFIFTGIGVCMLSRSDRFSVLSGLSKNKLFIIIVSAVATIQISMIYFGGDIFRCIPLSPQELLPVILLSFSVFPFDYIRKIFIKISKK